MAIRFIIEEKPVSTTNNTIPEDFTSKEEFLRFLNWLREQEEIFIDHRVVIRGFLNRYKHDYADDAMEVLKLVKKSKDVFEAYDAVSKYKASSKCSRIIRKKFSFLRYSEEIGSYLKEIGVDDEYIPELSWVISRGGYKNYLRNHGKKGTLIPFGDIDEWARGLNGLPSWNYIISYFPTEVSKMRESYNPENR